MGTEDKINQLGEKLYRELHRKVGIYFRGFPRDSTLEALTLLYRVVDRLSQDLVLSQVKAPCQKGCYHCCLLIPHCSPAEIFYVAAKIQKTPALSPGIRLEEYSRAFMENPLGPGRHFRECPFLQGGVCRIYEIRPLVCRCHYSEKKEFCQVGFPEGKAPQFLGSVVISEAAHAFLKDHLAGQFSDKVPFAPGVNWVLNHQPWRQWLEGERVFDSLLKAN